MDQVMFDTPENIQERSRVRNQEEQARKDAQELILICAQDMVDAWPKITLRTLNTMTARIDTLRQALQALK